MSVSEEVEKSRDEVLSYSNNEFTRAYHSMKNYERAYYGSQFCVGILSAVAATLAASSVSHWFPAICSLVITALTIASGLGRFRDQYLRYCRLAWELYKEQSIFEADGSKYQDANGSKTFRDQINKIVDADLGRWIDDMRKEVDTHARRH